MFVKVVRNDADFRGQLTVMNAGGQAGTREVRGADCESVESELAFIAAVIADPTAVMGANVAPASSPLPHPPIASERHWPIHVLAGAAIEADRGLTPSIPEIAPRVFAELDLGERPLGASARVSLGYGFPSNAATPYGTARVAHDDVRVEPCLRIRPTTSLSVSPCGVIETVFLRGTGTDAPIVYSATRSTAEVGLALQSSFRVAGQVDLGFEVGAAAPIHRFRFYFYPDATAYEIGAWSAFGGIAIGLRFW
jgi:hypothetical protein